MEMDKNMKHITLINNQWKERKNINLTQEEQELLRNMSEDKREEKNTLLNRIREESLVEATPEDAATAQAIYNQHKIDGSNLISVDIVLPGGTGIINCRVGEDHKQIRF